MKKRISFLFIVLPIVVISFISCQKEFEEPDSPFVPHEVAGTPLPGQSTYCRIESIWEHPFASDERFRLVQYDEYENPIFITTPSTGTSTPFRTFKYDNCHRLREYRGEYANGDFEFWHFYGYDLNGRIGVDTFYIFAILLPDGSMRYFERYISKIDYDGQGRISNVVTDGEFRPFHTEIAYNYDAAGNLIRPASDGVVYDNKMNINRTNDIWQFLSRDYSVNNPFTAAAYNTAGFPTTISSLLPILWSSEFQFGAPMQIGYGCR